MDTPSKRLKWARVKKGYASARAAATARGWNESTYRTHENGQRNYSIEDAKRYAAAYGVAWAWLLNGDDPPKLREMAETPASYAAPPSLYDTLTKQIYNPDEMTPEEEQAVFTLQRYLRRRAR